MFDYSATKTGDFHFLKPFWPFIVVYGCNRFIFFNMILLSIMYKRMDLDYQQLGICNAGLLGVYISNYICNYWYLLCV